MNVTTPIFALPSLLPALPEIVLALGALLMLLVGAIKGQSAQTQRVVDSLAIAVLLIALALVLGQDNAKVLTFERAFVSDGFSRFMKVLTLAGSIMAILLAMDFMKRRGIEKFEYSILITLATLGMMMMISANDLIALYIGLELQSLALYVVASIHRDDAKSSEAGLKYFVLGALASGMLLYGASLIYGFTGNINFDAIATVLQGNAATGAVFGLVFLMAGLAFKVSAVPFHMWTPDVYEGAPTPVTAFFAGAPKMAAIALFVRVMMEAFPGITHQWQQIVTFLAIASMVLGAFAAIGQSNLKRLMAYSSISNMGYALVALAAANQSGVQGVAIFMAAYLMMTAGVFACVLALTNAKGHAETIDDLAGLSKTRPGIAFILAMLMFSLVGIPPLAGFFGKYYAFAAAIEAKLYLLAVIGIVSSVVSAFYYLRIVKVMYFDEASVAYGEGDAGVKAVMAVSFAFVFLFAIIAGPVVTMAQAAAKSLL
ncbi:MAG: NADH-quinone oxidoreductase subunit NuoN [Methylocystis sp.]|nr:NADH-quinone oxidoreductase subunit NuoN [Methylocystis sp.]MCA3584145.1 NADH-quinone oxidoreductase subunit NuoN [Methylocystis sp.]MCA3586782.1 NADH-quinone oxidoreductase subunit NuoN [Methylocystis sp.]MCA3591265.1 NADH-quinone oxidoreductase subunit NuoN [Methylocystis sp.]